MKTLTFILALIYSTTAALAFNVTSVTPVISFPEETAEPETVTRGTVSINQ